MSKLKLIVLAGLFGFTLSGPLQHSGFLPQTSVGDASKAILKAVKNTVIPQAFAACTPEGTGTFGAGTLPVNTTPPVIVVYSGSATTTGSGFPSAPTTAGPTASAGATGGSSGNGSAGGIPATVATSGPTGGGSGSALPGAGATAASGPVVSSNFENGGGLVLPGILGSAGGTNAFVMAAPRIGASGGGGQGNGGFFHGDQSETVGKAASSGQDGGAPAGAGMLVTASTPILVPLAPPDERDFKARVLLVEDQEEDREKLRLLLHMEGYLVVTATDGEQGLKSFASFRPDITFVDRQLPGIDGLEFARKVRKGPSGKEAVLAVTGSGDEGERREAIAAGFDYYLAKPVDLAALQQALGGWASRTLRAAALTKGLR